MIGGILGGILGNIADDGDEKAASNAQQAALEAITGLKLPTIEEQMIALKQLESQGKLTPEMLETITQGSSEYENISADPRLKEAQMNALMSLSKQGEEGLTAMDRAALNDSRRTTERDVRGRNESILQNLAQRGMSGSGSELAAQLMNSQEGADRASQESDRIAAMAQERALQATASAATAATGMRGQEFSEKSKAAEAADAIARFNAANRQGVSQYNVGNRNDAQKYNLGESQRISDANANLSNQQQIHNKGLIQQDFTNRYNKANAVSGAQNTYAGQKNASAAQTRNAYSTVGQGIDKAGMEIAGMIATGGASAAVPKVGPKKEDGSFAYGGMVKDKSNYSQGSGSSEIPLMKYLHGGEVQGQAKHPGDHPENDTVEALVSPGEIIIPRSIAESSNEAILAFITQVKKSSKKAK